MSTFSTFFAVVSTFFVLASPASAADIAVLDRSKDLSYREIHHATAAVNAQLKQIAPVWGVNHRAIYRAQRPAGWWQIVVLDEDSTGGNPLVLGYHTTLDSGVPTAYVFARTSSRENFAWTTVLSHEALEMAVNPHLTNRFYDPVSGHTYDRELADAVEADEYTIGDVRVSDWVFPSWFDRNGTCPCDYLRLTTSPFQVRPGGYDPVFDDRTAHSFDSR